MIWHCEARVCGTDFVYYDDTEKRGVSLLTKRTKPHRRETAIHGRSGTTRWQMKMNAVMQSLDTKGDPFDSYTYIDPRIAYRAVISNGGVYIVGDKTGKVAPTMENIAPLPNPSQKTLVGFCCF